MEEIFNKDYFAEAIAAIFADLGPAQAMFGADGESSNVSALLAAAQSLVAFEMSFSTGIKVDNAGSLFNEGPGASNDLFFRLDNLGVVAETTAESIDLDIFSGVSIEAGN